MQCVNILFSQGTITYAVDGFYSGPGYFRVDQTTGIVYLRSSVAADSSLSYTVIHLDLKHYNIHIMLYFMITSDPNKYFLVARSLLSHQLKNNSFEIVLSYFSILLVYNDVSGFYAHEGLQREDALLVYLLLFVALCLHNSSFGFDDSLT